MPEWYIHPPLWLAPLFIIAGFWTLIKGADQMVGGAVVVAKRFRLTPAVIGATVVAFGTSLPELMVSLFSALAAAREGSLGSADGPAAIAVANVVGSNIFNLGAVLGFSALVCTLPVPRSSKVLDWPLMMLSGLLLVLMSWPLMGGDPMIVHWEGLLLFIGLISYVIIAMRASRKGMAQAVPEPGEMSIGKAMLLIIIGIVMLGIGGDITLSGALSLARSIGMTERVIGLTVMAIGTSLPELVTSIQAARRGQTDMAVGNVLGSNCFNVLCIIGISSMVVNLPVNVGTLYWDYFWMLGIPLILVPAIYIKGSIGRISGAILVLSLVMYVSLVLIDDQKATSSAPIKEQRREVSTGTDDVVGAQYIPGQLP